MALKNCSNAFLGCLVSLFCITLVGAQRDPESCTYHDSECWNEVALQYVNDIRISRGLAPFHVGTVSMLDNAVSHSRFMLDSNSFNHQDLSEVTQSIGCGIFCGAENIAYFGGKQSNPAKMCVDMWKNSEGHLANILSDANQLTVIGIFGEEGGKTYCTQTFGSVDLNELQSLGSSSRNCQFPSQEAKTPQQPTPNSPSMTERTNNMDTCTPSGIRCAGSTGHEYVPYLGCCSPDDECVIDSRPGASWGKFCLRRSESNTNDKPDVSVTMKSTLSHIRNYCFCRHCSQTFILTYSCFFFPFSTGDMFGRPMQTTGRSAMFSELCSYENNEKAYCELCLSGTNANVCVDASLIRNHYRTFADYANAF